MDRYIVLISIKSYEDIGELRCFIYELILRKLLLYLLSYPVIVTLKFFILIQIAKRIIRTSYTDKYLSYFSVIS